METKERTVITIQATVNAPAEKVWKLWNSPADIIQWNSASPDWHTPRAEQDLKPGGKFVFRMEAKDGSMGFDFGGMYDVVKPHEYLEYTIADGRKVKINFGVEGTDTKIVQTFEAESVNSPELQRDGWQAILDSFKKYAEAN